MSIELVLLFVNFFFLIGSVYFDDRVGQIFTLFILTVAAAETSIGLAILVAFYRIKGTIAVAFVNRLKG
jgi:NADH-quinone oxidoreductase subunit K